MLLVGVVCDISGTGQFPVQMSPTDCGVSVCVRECVCECVSVCH
jgi:hypothetical protein